MAKLKFKTKNIIRKIALVLAGVAAITAVGFGVKAISDRVKDDMTTIHPTFSVGNLGNDGKYVKDESSLYTKESFQCYGLEIKPDFNSEVNYQIYFYDDLDNFVESTEILTASFSGGFHDGYARLVIMPTNDEDGKISITERVKYPEFLQIKVKKNQNIEYFEVFNKRMMIVEDPLYLKFEYGNLSSTNGNYAFTTSGNHEAVTSTTLLKVKGGSRIESSAPTGFSLCVFQLVRMADGSFSVIKSSDAPVTLEKNTRYVILRYMKWVGQECQNLSSSELMLLPSYVSVS